MFIRRSGALRTGAPALLLTTKDNRNSCCPMSDIDITRLQLADAHDLAPLVAAYAQDRKRGAPRRPDDYYAEMLLSDRTAEILGARRDGRLIGFALFFDLPDAMTGMRAGQLDELFVDHGMRGQGIGRALVDALQEEGRRRGWVYLRWMVPKRPVSSGDLAETLAQPGDWKNYVIHIDRPSG
jgi:GNAT superfamily N-acetyltransferase